MGPISQSSLAALSGPQPGSSSSRGATALVRALEVAVQFRDRAGQAAATAEQVTGDPHLGCLLQAGELAADPVEPHGPVERSQRHLQGRVELVQVPAQPLLSPASLRDEIITVVDEQLQLPQRLLTVTRPFQLRFLESGSGDRERVDPVRLAARTVATPLRRRQPGRHPHQPLARSKQRLLEPAGHMPAVLQRPQPLPTGERLCPLNDTVVDRTGALGKRPADLVHGNGCERVLVHVHPDHDH